MSADVAGLLITGCFTLGGSLAGSAVTLYVGARRDRQLDRQVALARNLEMRRSVIGEFIVAYDESAGLAASGRSARARALDSEGGAALVQDLRRRLVNARAGLELLCHVETQPVLETAARLAAEVCARLTERTSHATSGLEELSKEMGAHKPLLITAFRAELGELG